MSTHFPVRYTNPQPTGPYATPFASREGGLSASAVVFACRRGMQVISKPTGKTMGFLLHPQIGLCLTVVNPATAQVVGLSRDGGRTWFTPPVE